MARGPEAYVDTSALIAFADRSDTYHPLFRRLFSDPPLLLTSSLVIAEGPSTARVPRDWIQRRKPDNRCVIALNRNGPDHTPLTSDLSPAAGC